ncbi:hypothetical protein MASSI9I_50602 [Massilia sp. 9I]|nr:hypothetical protein MASSI9I_50602 [Massilia sp. 9I]
MSSCFSKIRLMPSRSTLSSLASATLIPDCSAEVEVPLGMKVPAIMGVGIASNVVTTMLHGRLKMANTTAWRCREPAQQKTRDKHKTCNVSN